MKTEPQQQVGTWAPFGAIADPRTGAGGGIGRWTHDHDGWNRRRGTDGGRHRIRPLTNSGTAAGELTVARYRHTATLLDDGRIVVVGGETADGTTADVEIFDPASGTSTLIASLAQARGLMVPRARATAPLTQLLGVQKCPGYSLTVIA